MMPTRNQPLISWWDGVVLGDKMKEIKLILSGFVLTLVMLTV